MDKSNNQGVLLKSLPIVEMSNERRIEYSNCIWCFAEQKLSRSHLFPQCLGGRFTTYSTCEQCNSYLGHSIESLASKNAFLSQAMVTLGISDSRTAFCNARLYDVETELELVSDKGGGVSSISKPVNDQVFVGTPEQRAEYFTKRASRRDANIDVTPLRDFLLTGKPERFSFDGRIYSTKEFPEKMTEIRIEGLQRDPSYQLVFKIVYEFMAMLNFLMHPTIGKILISYLNSNESDSSSPFNISDSVSKYVVSNTDACFREYRELGNIPFKRFNHSMLRLTPERWLWCEIGFFGTIHSWFLITKIEDYNQELTELLDRVFVFPLDNPKLEIVQFPSLKNKNYYSWVNAKLDFRISELQSAGISMPLQSIDFQV